MVAIAKQVGFSFIAGESVQLPEMAIDTSSAGCLASPLESLYPAHTNLCERGVCGVGRWRPHPWSTGPMNG